MPYVNAELKLPQLLRNYLEAKRAAVGLPDASVLPFEAWHGALLDLSGGVAATGIITTATPHGFVANDPVTFPSLTGGSGLETDAAYYLHSAPSLTTLKLTDEPGGDPLALGSDITAGQIRTLRDLRRPYVGFSCSGFTAPHPLLQRLEVECNLHVCADDTPPAQDGAWVAGIRAALSDGAALSTWLAALSSAARAGWRMTGYQLTGGEVEIDSDKALRMRRTTLAIRCQATETAGIGA